MPSSHGLDRWLFVYHEGALLTLEQLPFQTVYEVCQMRINENSRASMEVDERWRRFAKDDERWRKSANICGTSRKYEKLGNKTGTMSELPKTYVKHCEPMVNRWKRQLLKL